MDIKRINEYQVRCAITEEEIAEIRAGQEAAKANPGIYGEYAKHRDLTMEEIEANIAAGKPYPIVPRPPDVRMLRGRVYLK